MKCEKEEITGGSHMIYNSGETKAEGVRQGGDVRRPNAIREAEEAPKMPQAAIFQFIRSEEKEGGKENPAS